MIVELAETPRYQYIFTCSYSSSSSANSYIGGIVGDCSASDGSECLIENSINMASVTFSGNLSGDSSSLHIGGIAGHLYYYSSHDVRLRNCANYGNILHTGSCGISYVGGIAGYSYGSSSSHSAYVLNSLNYGTVKYSGTTGSLYLGGILGQTYRSSNIENCVSAGKVTVTKLASVVTLEVLLVALTMG